MTENKKCNVQFIYNYKGSKYDDVGVVGNLNELNNWNINNPVNLKYSETEKNFKSDTLFLSNNINFEYKYVFFTNNEHKWEELPYNQNRKMEITNEPFLIIEDIQDNPIPKKIIQKQKEKINKPVKKKKIDKTKIEEQKEEMKTEKKEKEEMKQTKIEDIKDNIKTESKKVKKKIIKKVKKKKDKKEEEEKKKEEEEKKKKNEEEDKIKNEKMIDNERKPIPINNANTDLDIEQKLKVLDYDSDNEEEKDKEQKPREPQQYSEIKEEDDIIMCSFNLPFVPVKQEQSFILKLTNSPLYHILYKVIENEKNIKWFGSLRDESIYNEEEREEISKLLKEKNMYLINVEKEIYEKTQTLYYNILEPLCHYITLDENDMDNYVNFSEYWKEYKKYIESVCNTILPFISKKKKTIIFLHDYYFYLFPSIFLNKCTYNKEYQELLPNISIGLYIHVPFPSHEIFKRIPSREEIIASLIKCQVLGFHTFDHSRNFLKTSKRLLGANFVSTTHGDLAANYLENTALIRVKTVTPDIDLIKTYQKEKRYQEKYLEITNKYKGKILFVTMDHSFFPITIKNKLVAYKRFLASIGEKAKKVVLLMVIRNNMEEEEEKKQDLETINRLTQEIKEEFNDDVIEIETGKLQYIERLALLASANCFVRTTKQESFSLSVYEYLILRKLYGKEAESVCIISELSGVNTSLANTIKVNPFDYNSLKKGFSDAFQQLGTKEYSDKDFVHAEKSSFKNWFYSFLKDIKNIKLSDENTYYLGVDDTFNFKLKKINSKFNKIDIDLITKFYGRSFKRLIFLDFEGTLPSEDTGQVKIDKPFKDRRPSEEILNLLTDLSNDKKNSVYIVAGKGKSQLEDWFGSIKNLGLSAEHGFLYKANSQDKWKYIVDTFDTEWRKSCVNIIEPYTQRCEGSFLEIKEFSVVWQYSECDQELGKAFASVITSELQVALKNKDVKILNGKGFVEVIALGINKGYFVSYIVKEKIKQQKPPDFILCIGDDASDEKMFRFLKLKQKEIKNFNQKAKLISITVGKKPSEADYYVNNVKDVQELIHKLTLKLAKSVSTFDIKKAALALEQEQEEEKEKKLKESLNDI